MSCEQSGLNHHLEQLEFTFPCQVHFTFVWSKLPSTLFEVSNVFLPQRIYSLVLHSDYWPIIKHLLKKKMECLYYLYRKQSNTEEATSFRSLLQLSDVWSLQQGNTVAQVKGSLTCSHIVYKRESLHVHDDQNHCKSPSACVVCNNL